MKIPNNIMLIVIGCIAISILMFFLSDFVQRFLNKQYLRYDFAGKVERIKYDNVSNQNIIKPTVVINGKLYHLYYSKWHFGHSIEIGDSIIKKVNTMTIILKKRNGRIFHF